MPRYIGCDVHKREAQIAILDDDGAWAEPVRIPVRREALTAFCQAHLRPDDRLALEATFHTWALVPIFEPFVAEVVVSNPLRTKAIGDRTTIKNRLHAILHHRLIPVDVSDLFNRPGRAWLAALPLDATGRAALDSELRLLDAIEAEIKRSDDELATLAYHDHDLKLLMTLPGVDFGIACTLQAALGDITRFRDGAHAASYLGLVPSTRQSGDHCYHGPITRHGNSHARWLLVQAAQHLAAHPGPLGVFFRRLLKKKNRNVAVVACARKLVVIAWHMLTRQEPYRYSQPMPTQAKLTRLRTRVTHERRRGGIPKSAPRPANYGQGRTRRVPTLAETYTAENLPAPFALAPGEQRMLRDQGIVRFHQRLRQSHRVPKPGSYNPPSDSDLQTGTNVS